MLRKIRPQETQVGQASGNVSLCSLPSEGWSRAGNKVINGGQSNLRLTRVQGGQYPPLRVGVSEEERGLAFWRRWALAFPLVLHEIPEVERVQSPPPTHKNSFALFSHLLGLMLPMLLQYMSYQEGMLCFPLLDP